MSGKCMCSWVKTDWNCVLSVLALSCGCVTKESLCSSVVIPVVSCLRALKKLKNFLGFWVLFVRKVEVYLVSAYLVSFCSVFCMFL